MYRAKSIELADDVSEGHERKKREKTKTCENANGYEDCR